MWIRFVICDLVAVTRSQREFPSVLQFSNQFSLQNEKHVASSTPMVSNIAWRVFDHSDADISGLHSAPMGRALLSPMLTRRDRTPLSRGKRGSLELHLSAPFDLIRERTIFNFPLREKNWLITLRTRTLARVVIDVNGRRYSFIGLNAEGARLERVDDMLAQDCVEELSQRVGGTINLDILKGHNSHHSWETACRAIGEAVSRSLQKICGERLQTTRVLSRRTSGGSQKNG